MRHKKTDIPDLNYSQSRDFTLGSEFMNNAEEMSR